MKRKTTEEFIDNAIKVNGDKYDYSKVEYINNKTKVCIICPKHGEFWQIPSDHLRGYGCKKCGIVLAHDKCSKNKNYFEYKSNQIHEFKYDYSKVDYINNKTKVCIICPEHGEFWQKPNDHLSGYGCPKCGGTLKLTQNEFICKSKKIHNDKYNYSKVKYINNKTKVCIICLKHGEFWQTPHNHLRGQGCSKCKQSKMEIEIEKLLKEHKINFISQAKKKDLYWLGLQSLDFYLPDYKVGIECQGEQHFSSNRNFGSENFDFTVILRRDEEKRIKCQENNVKLLYYSNLGMVYPYKIFEDKEKLLEEIQKNGRKQN